MYTCVPDPFSNATHTPSILGSGRRYPDVPLLALTATATPRVQHDVVVQLGMQSCLMFRNSFNRPNLRSCI